MCQIVPDWDNPSISIGEEEEEETYSSIDDVPQPIVPDDKFLSNAIVEHSNQFWKQSMKFHLGTPVTNLLQKTLEKDSEKTLEKIAILPDLVPTHFSPTHNENFIEISSDHMSDQIVPQLPDSPDYNNKPPSPNSPQGFYYKNPQSNDLTHRRKHYNAMPVEWRSPKLSSHKLEALNRALVCYSQRCHDPVCKMGKCLLEETQKRIQTSKLVNSDDRQILEYLLEHSAECTEFFCISPGCNQMETSPNTLQKLFESLCKDKKDFRFSSNAILHRFSNCCMMCPKDVCETTMYAFTSTNSISIFQNYKWAKVTVLGEIMQDILPLLIKIGQLSNHPNVLPIDWLIDDGIIYYSTEHFAEPLKYKFEMMAMDKKEIILRLIEAALYLNENGVAFLAWTSENICWKNGIVRLTNFHMGSASYHDFDQGVIKSLLFPTILPPELNCEITDLKKADVWGVCCLLYELITNEVVHSHLLHMERNLIWRKLDETGWTPRCPSSDPQLQNIFEKGWQEEPQNRSSLKQLKYDILNYRNDF